MAFCCTSQTEGSFRRAVAASIRYLACVARVDRNHVRSAGEKILRETS